MWRHLASILRHCRKPIQTTCGLALLTVSALSPARADAQTTTNLPLFHYAVFYEGLLEFSTCATMVMNGQVHANNSIYVGSSSPLTFNKLVTCAGSISSPSNNSIGPWPFPGNVAFNSTVPYVTNLPPLPLTLGTNFTGSNYLHNLIEQPPAGESPSSLEGRARFYNQAAVVLLISNNTVTARIQSPPTPDQPAGADPAPLIISMPYSATTNFQNTLRTNFHFLQLTNRFYDQRENKTNLVAEIDVSRFRVWLLTNFWVNSKYPGVSNRYPSLLYVADNRPNSAGQLSSVRLTNGITIPVNGGAGWTLATPNPLYVLGNFNCTNTTHLGTTNTTSALPCALISDALTLLSSSWNDQVSFTDNSTGPDASSSLTINAAFIIGNRPSTGANNTRFSGGIHNLPRLLEDWSSSTLWLNTSITCLYASTKATGQFITPGSSSYYVPPTRKFSFDSRYLDPNRQPPGAPYLIEPIRLRIVSQPQSLVLDAGMNAIFGVGGEGTPAVNFQWRFNGQLVGTLPTLLLTNVTLASAGVYAATISNPFGSLTSVPATLSVISTNPNDFPPTSQFVDGSFHFLVPGPIGANMLVEASTNLTDWVPLITHIAPFVFADGQSDYLTSRFYRAVPVP